MRTVLTFLFLFVQANQSFSQITGNYSKKGKDFLYTLTLNADSTFSFSKVYYEADSKCEGKWKKLRDNSLLLNCAESTLAEKLQRGYMNEREIHVQVLKNNRLKVDKVIMRRN